MDYYIDCPMENGTVEKLRLHRLSEKYITEAAQMCDRCVGKNLYTTDYLTSILHEPEHFFYLLFSDKDIPVGYMYFIMMDRAELARISKLDTEQLDLICDGNDKMIGNLRSIGVEDPYRKKGLSVKLIQFSMDRLAALGAHVIVGLCWKAGDTVPMRRTMHSCGLQYLTDAHRVWYDIESLKCPYCGGRCKCDAEIYYKHLEVKQ